jgi:aspartate 1-decarboxylase
MRSFLRSKIHRATVTQAELHYEGSLTLDRLLMVEADILPGEEVHVWNVTQGTRFSTYAIEGPADTGVLCVNGAAAHLADNDREDQSTAREAHGEQQQQFLHL